MTSKRRLTDVDATSVRHRFNVMFLLVLSDGHRKVKFQYLIEYTTSGDDRVGSGDGAG